MTFYKIPITMAEASRHRQIIDHERKSAWRTAQQDVLTIRAVGICICMGLCTYLAFNAF